MRKRALLWAAALAVAGHALAQDNTRTSVYKLSSTSLEFGYRAVSVSGDGDAYRSAINYDTGFRLFNGNFQLNSSDGHGRFFDTIVMTTTGAIGDPYQAHTLRVEKNGLYRFDMGIRVVDYFNRLLALSDGQHRFDTERTLQSYDLTLFPQSRVQVVFGYDRSSQNGPALTSEFFDMPGDPAFPRDNFFFFASNLRIVTNEYRAGANATFGGVTFSFVQSLNDYKEDSVYSPGSPLAPVPLPDTAGSSPQSLQRSYPIHGLTPVSRLNIHSDANRRLTINARGVYSGGDHSYILDENLAALSSGGVLSALQTSVLGNAKRTQGTGDLTLVFRPTEQWSLTNATSVDQSRITGDSAFVELHLPLSAADSGMNQYFFSFLGIRLITNSTGINYRPNKKIGFYAGYNYSIRRIQSRENTQPLGIGAPVADAPLYSFNNVLNSGVLGVRLRPVAPLTMLFDVEYGRNSHPFTPASEKNFQNETARIQWKSGAWLLGGSFKRYHNLNSVPAIAAQLAGSASSAVDYESRQYGVDLSWTPASRFSFDAGYARLHLNTDAGIVNFLLPGLTPAAQRQALYLSNIHNAHTSLRVQLPKGSSLFFTYMIVKDTAGGRQSIDSVPPFTAAYPSVAFNGTNVIVAYPLRYESPQVRLSIPLHKRLSWDVGWQYYGYSEKFSGLQNYHANVSFTSLTLSL